jgi:hypothetical protein
LPRRPPGWRLHPAGNHDGLAGRGLRGGRDRIGAAAAAGVIEKMIDAAAAAARLAGLIT